MTAADPRAARTGRSPNAVAAIRWGAAWTAVSPLLAAVYLLSTPGRQHRPLLLAVDAVLLLVAAGTWWSAPRIARSRARVELQFASMLAFVAGAATLGALDGGVTGPLGPMLLFAGLFYAILLPPRPLILMSAVALSGYLVVAAVGGPSPAGWVTVFCLGFTGGGYLCHRHTRALVSLRRRLAEVSRIDPLTRCLNRRGFDERLEQELDEARRTGDPLTLVLIDLDRFKSVNDTYGHRAGDELLARTGLILRERLRTHDAVGRLGGDEFGAVLADTPVAGARLALDRLREGLAGCAPASLGHASYPADGTTAEQLTHVADERLYRDKSGRERTGPSAEAVAAARDGGAASAVARVSPRERRRRAIADMGRMSMSNNIIGLLYVAVLGPGGPDRGPMALLLATALTLAVAMIAAAERLSRVTWAHRVVMATALLMFLLDSAAIVLDGGVASPMALGLIVPLPLVALGTPRRLAVPIIGIVALDYVVIGLTVGDVDPWLVAMQVTGALIVAVACGRQGLAAATQRTLLTRLSRADVLTDSLNRRGFEERFDAELAHARRTGRSLCLVVLDLDGFKQLNDSRGHAAGDELLVWVAQRLQRSLHPHDVVGRLGGDEFVALLGARPPEAADAVVEGLRADLAERTPVSIGAAVLERDGASFDELYAAADARLYADKDVRRRRDPAAQPARVGSSE